jgi:hypothetical protein
VRPNAVVPNGSGTVIFPSSDFSTAALDPLISIVDWKTPRMYLHKWSFLSCYEDQKSTQELRVRTFGAFFSTQVFF